MWGGVYGFCLSCLYFLVGLQKILIRMNKKVQVKTKIGSKPKRFSNLKGLLSPFLWSQFHTSNLHNELINSNANTTHIHMYYSL